MKVGFVGLGNMGSVMARNLIKAGHTLTVYNQTRSRAEELRSLGATVARNSSEAASGAEALITMVADDRAVEDVIFGQGNVIGSLPAGSVHISMSTMGVALSHRLVAAHREKKSTLHRGACLRPARCRRRCEDFHCGRRAGGSDRALSALVRRHGTKDVCGR